MGGTRIFIAAAAAAAALMLGATPAPAQYASPTASPSIGETRDTQPPSPTLTVKGGREERELGVTGADVLGIAALGLGSLGVGGALVARSRRRRA